MIVGERVAVQINNWTTRFGKVVKIGRTMVHIVANGGIEVEAYKPSMVYPISEYEQRNPNPYGNRLAA